MNTLALSKIQQEAVDCKDGQVVVFAGAGSGKTRIITTRIASLIDQGESPRRILAVTFTNRAANEMRERVEQLSPPAKDSIISTFHAACARWLREFATELELTPNFLIYDQKDSIAALKTVLNTMDVPLSDDSAVSVFHSLIARAKVNCVFADEDDKIVRLYPTLMASGGHSIYRYYQQYLKSCNAVDFGDLILNVVFLLRRNAGVRDQLQNRFRYILVDEYQDINQCQFELITLLAAKQQNLFVVGDDDQSIYSWRGASPQKILQFQEFYPQARKIILDQNYRSSAIIVNAAGALIAKNSKRVAKEIWTANSAGHRIEFRNEPDAEMEAYTIVDTITNEQDKFPLGDIAIFYRTNSQSRLLEDTLRRANINYQIYGSLRFYDRVEIKDILAYFRLAVNPNDNASFKRVINIPRRGIGLRSIETIEELAIQGKCSMLHQARELVCHSFPKIGAKLQPFIACFDSLQAELLHSPVSQAVEIFLRTIDYQGYIQKKYKDRCDDKNENIFELDTAIKDFAQKYRDATLNDWLQTVALTGDEIHQNGESVSMMTLHAAKGLEFKRVYLSGIEEGLIPHRNSLNSRDEVEEERRLLYVGMTRAREKLTLTSATQRRSFSGWTTNRPSRFLADIPETCLDVEGIPPPIRNRRVDNGAPAIAIGMQIIHPTYGMGYIERIEKNLNTVDVLVNFNEFGPIRVKRHHLRL